MSADVELKYEIQCSVREIKRTCKCALKPKPEDNFCIHCCSLCAPRIYDIKKGWKERQRRW